ncbi:MAG: phenylalanine--tRNA ligase subunit beta [Rhodospirillales bacterium]|nr:phenylalanine--tRNA ligase subunit beta [Rhodospirillales bacterium]
MKLTLGWLKTHLETDATAEAVARRLTMIGHEVEAVVDRGAALKDFVVAEVVAAEPHPNADKLRVCTVETGRGRVQVVCGAPNARAGMKGVFAAPGTRIPGLGVTLKAAAVRGVDSAGMLLSEREVGLSDAHVGIIELAAEARVGAPAAEAMGLADPLIDVAITPNRGDCLGVRGLARDLAAAGLGRLKPVDASPVSGAFASPIGVALAFSPETAGACPYFVGRHIRGVRNASSPPWLQDRLRAVGLRPISALVDITNYMTLDLCRPLHAFDAGQVRGSLQVRLARAGERLQTLDGREVELDQTMTVIADDTGPEALGGIMGGARSGCGEATTEVFLEAALFDPIRTAATGRKLNIHSDARFRFERGVDPAFLVPGIEIATRMVLELCGGEASELVIAGAEPAARPAISFRPSRVEALAGVAVEPEEARSILADLGFAAEEAGGGGSWRVSIPTWRNDVDTEACLVEEVVRIVGYDRIPTLALPRLGALPGPAVAPGQRRLKEARRLLATRGLMEAVTFSFLSADRAALFGGGDAALQLINPISVDLSVMRPSLLANLIDAVKRNDDRGQGDGALFELGPQYAGPAPEDQAVVAAGVRSGRAIPRHWAVAQRPVDVFDAKADVFAILHALGAPVEKLTVDPAGAPEWYHPGRSAAVRLGPKATLAVFGEVHPKVLRRLGAKPPVVAFELFFAQLPPVKGQQGKARPPLTLSALQPVERDFAFVVDASVAAEAVVRAARGAEKALIRDVRVFDVFEGAALPQGKKSLAITVILQPQEQTLTDAEIEAVAGRIIAAVEGATGGRLRG